MKSQASNEATLDGKCVVIKCAAPATPSVGVTYKMLERLDAIIGAFQLDDGSFELWALDPAYFRNGMRDTRSRGSSAGKVGLVKKRMFIEQGEQLKNVRLG